MKTSTSTVLGTAVAIAISVFTIAALADGNNHANPNGHEAERIAHGRYIVHQVGLCIDCHSPRNERGEHIESKHLTGAPLSPHPSGKWAQVAPSLAGLPAGYSPEDLVHFLMTGERPHGLPPPLPPMPPYRLNRADAEAVAAYLRSLPKPAL